MKKYLMLLGVLLGASKSFARVEGCVTCKNVQIEGKIINVSFSKNISFQVKKGMNIVIKDPLEATQKIAIALCQKMQGTPRSFRVLRAAERFKGACFKEYAEFDEEAFPEVKDTMGGGKFGVANWNSVFESNKL